MTDDLRLVTVVVPGSLSTVSGGYIYDRRMVDGLRRRDWCVEVRELDDSFPWPSCRALESAADVLAGIPSGSVALVDGLAFGAMPELVERETSRLRIVALVHLPLALEVGLSPAAARDLERSERRALACAAAVVVTGCTTVETLTRYGVPASRIHVVEPGTDRAPLARGLGRAIPHLVSVATLSPGKGHGILIDALASLRDREWTLALVGSVRRSPETVERLRAQLRDRALADRVTITGELTGEALAAEYDRADLFVLATLRETYGMVIAEALARGLPVVSTTTGAIPCLVGDGAGLLVSPGDAGALAEALRQVLDDRRFRSRLAEGARQAREGLPSWDAAVDRLAAVLGRVHVDG